jgi:hypothetical protein
MKRFVGSLADKYWKERISPVEIFEEVGRQ